MTEFLYILLQKSSNISWLEATEERSTCHTSLLYGGSGQPAESYQCLRQELPRCDDKLYNTQPADIIRWFAWLWTWWFHLSTQLWRWRTSTLYIKDIRKHFVVKQPNQIVQKCQSKNTGSKYSVFCLQKPTPRGRLVWWIVCQGTSWPVIRWRTGRRNPIQHTWRCSWNPIRSWNTLSAHL